MRELTDANRYQNRDIPDGIYTFTIKSITSKTKGETKFYVLKVGYADGEGEQILLPSMIGPLLRLLGAKEPKPNVFDWDTQDFDGMEFRAKVSHAPDKKDPTKVRQHMGYFEAAKKEENEIPF